MSVGMSICALMHQTCATKPSRTAGDPIFMTSTWVYPPTELLGFRPATNTSWKMNTTQEFKYQTLYVTSTGVPAKNGAVDSLAWWSQKPKGVTGPCYLVGFNSATAPDVDSPKAGQWKTLISGEFCCSPCGLHGQKAA